MPFYEYQCRACGVQVEVMQKISDAPLKKCPECGKSQLTRLISAPVFRLKGGGWYETDFKTDKDNKRNLVEAKSEAKTETKTETKAETKAETKSETKAETRTDARPATKKPVKATKPAKKKGRR
jgi:putative FmdB family regulatory protein